MPTAFSTEVYRLIHPPRDVWTVSPYYAELWAKMAKDWEAFRRERLL